MSENIADHTTSDIARMRFSLAAAGIGTWDVDTVSREVRWDEQCTQLFGFSSGDSIAYEDTLSYVHPDDLAAVTEAVTRALDPAIQAPYEVRYRTLQPDGGVRWILSRGKAYFTDGVVTRFAGTAQDTTRSMQERERTEASEKIARQALEHSNSGYYHITLLTGDIDYSPGYSRLLTGRVRKGLTRNDFVKYIHPDDLGPRDSAHEEARASGKLNFEFRVIWEDGSLHWLHALGTYLRDLSGTLYLLTGTIRETTAEHHYREAMREAEDTLATAFDHASMGMAVGNLQGNFVKVNKAFTKMLQYEEAELLTMNYRTLTHPDDLPECDKLFGQLLSFDRNFFNYKKRYLRKNGTSVWVQINVTNIGAAGEREGQVLLVARDISAELANEKALISQEMMFRNVTNSSPTGLWLSDEEGGLTYLNNTLVDWTGMPYASLLGTGWANAVIEEDRQRGADAYMSAIAARAHYDVMFRIRKGNGDIVWTRAAGDPYYREDGSYAGYAGFCMDIDELVSATEQQRHSEQRFRDLIDQAPIATCLFVGRELRVEVANDIMLGYWGKGKEAIGLPLIEALPELRGQPVLDILDEIFTTCKPYQAKAAPIDIQVNGVLSTYYFDFSYQPVFDTEGRIYGIMEMAIDVTEQVLTSKRLEESEGNFRSIVEQSPIAIGLLRTRDMVIEIGNAKIFEAWGKDPSITGMKLIDALPELSGQAFIGLLHQVYDTGIAYNGNGAKAQIFRNGALEDIYFDFVYTPIHDAAGVISGVMVLATDVTEQSIAKTKLEESELFSRSIFENSPIAKLVFVGEDMKIRTVNERMLDMLGRSDWVIGMPFMVAVPELLETPLMDRLRHVYRTGDTHYSYEEKISLIRSGELYTGYYNYIYKALRNLSGDIYGIMVTATDVTDQVLARQKIEEAENNLRGAIELADLGTWHIDMETRTLHYDARMRGWFGIGPEEVITVERAYRPIAPEYHPLVRAAIFHATDPMTDGVYDVEYTTDPAETGTERIIHAQGRAMFGAGGRVYRISGTAQDVTAQRRIQLALEQEVKRRTEEIQVANEELHAANGNLMRSNEELAQYAYVASHDLQEPLRKIRYFSDVLSNEGLNDKSRVLITKIMSSAERMSMLIRDLLEFSRLLQSDTLVRQLSLDTAIEVIIRDFELTIEERKATINIGTLPEIEAVGLQMNQLFYNLLNNALKFSRADVPPVISITAHPVATDEVRTYLSKVIHGAQYYEITFTDNGIGFEMEYAEHIFEIFKRLHTKDVYTGSGIGLSLCRRIVLNHNGCIYAKSEIGRGSAFHIILPDRQREAEV